MVPMNKGAEKNLKKGTVAHYYKKRILLSTSSFTSTITKMAQPLFLIFQPLENNLTKNIRLF